MKPRINKLSFILILSLMISVFSLQAVHANGVKVTSKLVNGKYQITLSSQEKGKGIKIIALSTKSGKTVNVTYSLVKGGHSSATAQVDENLVIAPFRIITTNSDNLSYRPYTDIINTEYDEYVRHLHDMDVITAAYKDTKFKPQTMVTRAEVASMLALSLNLKLNSAGKSKFNDVDKHWAKKYINAVIDKGIMSPADSKNFKPDGKITIAEACSMISKAFTFKTRSEGVYTKLKKGQWYSESVQNIFNLRILTPQDNIYNSFNENSNVSRGNFAMMLSRALSTY